MYIIQSEVKSPGPLGRPNTFAPAREPPVFMTFAAPPRGAWPGQSKASRAARPPADQGGKPNLLLGEILDHPPITLVAAGHRWSFNSSPPVPFAVMIFGFHVTWRSTQALNGSGS